MMAILISVMGLLGLSIHASHQRIKEVAIRKVSGAGVGQILVMLNKDFTKWVLLSVIIGSVLAYFIMQNWLMNFELQTAISWWIFGLTGILTLIIALATVSWQSWRAAVRNPIDALRHE